MKVGLVGAGKRMSTLYVKLLHAVGHEVVGFTTRRQLTAQEFSAKTGIENCKTLEDLASKKPDYLLICVNASGIIDTIKKTIPYGIHTLVETPITDVSIVDVAKRSPGQIGVLEQWPYLPLEQFKSAVISAGLMSQPNVAINDCRTFDYHAIAQLRTYLGRPAGSMTVTAQQLSFPLAQFELDGQKKSMIDSWLAGQVKFNEDKLLSHQFSYACKVAPFRSIQSLRSYSNDGTIFSGKMYDRDDDCEMIDIEYLENGRTKKLDVTVDRNDSGAIVRITSPVATWTNPLADAGLTDHELATAQHILHIESVVNNGKKMLYDIRDAALDQLLVYALDAAAKNPSVKLSW